MFLGVFMVAISAITFLLGRVSLYMELLGLTSLLMEACLGLPQLWRNHSNKSTEGMRYVVVPFDLSGVKGSMNIVRDGIFKGLYFQQKKSRGIYFMVAQVLSLKVCGLKWVWLFTSSVKLLVLV